MKTVTRRYRFSASHRLHVPSLSEEQNQELYGKCNNPFGHGHNYILDVSVAGEVPARTGRLFPLSDLDNLVHTEILTPWESRNLNLDIAQFATLVPTTENVAVVIRDLLQSSWSRLMPAHTYLARVYIEETARNSFEIVLPRPAASVAPQSSVVEAEVLHD